MSERKDDVNLHGQENAVESLQHGTDLGAENSVTSLQVGAGAQTYPETASGPAGTATAGAIIPDRSGLTLSEELAEFRQWIVDRGLSLPDDWQNQLREIRYGPPRLTEDEQTFLARIRRTRKAGFLLSIEDQDILLQIVERLSQ